MNSSIEERSLKHLQDPNQWCHFGVCPVKNREKGDGFPLCGLVPKGKSIVKILNLFAGWTPDEWDAAETYEYDSLESLVADGWEVD
jgi:hypothetical protein